MAESPHLSDYDLEALLDQHLDPTAERAARLHLEGCRDCRRRAEMLGRLFSAIQGWEQVDPPHDLTSTVVESLRREKAPGGLRAVTVQAGVAVMLMVLAWPTAVRFLSSLSRPPLPVLDLTWIDRIGGQGEAWLRAADRLWGAAGVWLRLATPAVPMWPAVLAAGLLLAVLGNSILLAGGQGGRRRIETRRS
ncbi:MAG TPA: hypothetical protein VK449_06860 [Anaerolineales bacterium]|nr:hypothetical protein [Anaerolineales bacterium]